MYNRSLAIWGVFSTPDNGNPIQLIWFIMAGLKRLKWEEVNKLKGMEFEVLLEFNKENIQLKKKEFNHLCEEVKINSDKAIADKKFGELAVFFYIVILMFQICKGELIL